MQPLVLEVALCPPLELDISAETCKFTAEVSRSASGTHKHIKSA